MKRLTLILLVALAAIAVPLVWGMIGVGGGAPAHAASQTGSLSDGVHLTVYNTGTALVVDRRSFAILQGLNQLDFTEVASGIDRTSVRFASLTDPFGTTVLEQNFVFDLVNAGALLNRYIDQTIEVVSRDDTTYGGELLNGSDALILRADDGRVIVVRRDQVRDIRFPDPPGGLITRPTLRWLLQSTAGGEQQVELTYMTTGINWAADYTLLLANDEQALDLDGWITFSNTSGAAYRDAQVKLVAGDVNRLPPPPPPPPAPPAPGATSTPQPTPTPAVSQREFYEYQLYEIERPVTVGDNETKQVEFVTRAGIPALTFYRYEASPFYGYTAPINDPSVAASASPTAVQTYLEFNTGEENGLDIDLPSGRVRVYQEDVDGAALLIREGHVDHTPAGETITLYLGDAFDLVGERRQASFNQLSANVIEETFEIRLRNHKDEAVEVRVPEHLYRWSDWEIVSASQEYTQLDAGTIEFRAQVEPGMETVITYTVRYTFP